MNDLQPVHLRTSICESGVLRQLWSETQLPWWANRDGIDVFWGSAHRLPRWLPKRIARVVTVHDLVWKYAPETMRPLLRQLEQWQMSAAIRNADWIVADSQATAEAIRQEYGANYNNLSVVPLGVSLSGTPGSPELLRRLGIDRNYFLFVGVLEPRKNLLRLLEAYARLAPHEKEQAAFVVAGGNGWGNLDLVRAIDRAGLREHVWLVGHVDDDSLATLYANAQFLAMPSLYEGFGLPIPEAMNFGTPVLTSNNSSMPEVAGDAGLLVNPLDIDSITKGLRRLISDESLRGELASHAKESAARFDWNRSASLLVDAFEKAIAMRATHRLCRS